MEYTMSLSNGCDPELVNLKWANVDFEHEILLNI